MTLCGWWNWGELEQNEGGEMTKVEKNISFSVSQSILADSNSHLTLVTARRGLVCWVTTGLYSNFKDVYQERMKYKSARIWFWLLKMLGQMQKQIRPTECWVAALTSTKWRFYLQLSDCSPNTFLSYCSFSFSPKANFSQRGWILTSFAFLFSFFFLPYNFSFTGHMGSKARESAAIPVQ